MGDEGSQSKLSEFLELVSSINPNYGEASAV